MAELAATDSELVLVALAAAAALAVKLLFMGHSEARVLSLLVPLEQLAVRRLEQLVVRLALVVRHLRIFN
jgi:hypothetical protein